jgi:hypothetical protein
MFARATTLLLTTLGFGAAMAVGLACGNDSGSDGDLCVPNQQVSCACPGGVMGVQSCTFDGAGYDLCQCGDAGTGGDDDGSGTADTAGSGDGDTGAACGNGLAEPGECTGDDPACPEDCGMADGTTGDMEGTTGGVDSCAGMPIYVASVPSMPSIWTSGMLTGFGAGVDLCQAMGADGVCDYDQVLAAEAAGEFAAMAPGTAWLHRTTPANGVAAQPGGRCVDWTYGTNHISDGEFVEFGAGGVVTYNLDNDTTYAPGDGDPNPHVQVGVLECGGVNRAILCCNECVGEG